MKEKNLIKVDGKKYKKEAFMIEESHPAIGRILIIDGEKYKILDEAMSGAHRSGTFIARMTEKDEEEIERLATTEEIELFKLKIEIDKYNL